MQEAASLALCDAENISTTDFNIWRRFCRKRLEVSWRHHFWPDLAVCEQRFYRLAWNAEQTYYPAVAGVDNSANEVYWALTGQYFAPLQTVPPNTPPTDGYGNVNMTYWAITQQYAIQPDPSGTQYNQPVANVLPWSSTTTYFQGNAVQYANNVYVLFTANVLGDLPTDAANWGLLPPFVACIPYEQTGFNAFSLVEECFSANPAATTRGNTLDWMLNNNGIVVRTVIAYAWVQYRLRCPKLSGVNYSSSTAYAAGAQFYYGSATLPGNFYNVVTATNAGDTPDSAPAKFSVVAIPRIFHRYLVLGMAADWGTYQPPADPQAPQMAQVNEALAQAELDDVKSQYVGQMGQRVQTQVRTR